MGEESQDRLRHLFPQVHTLAPPIRTRLSALLASPGSMPAVLAEELRDLPLPTEDRGRRELRAVIEKGLGREALAALRTLPLSDVVPPINSCQGGPTAGSCPARTIELLAREKATTWADLSARTLGEIARWPGMGPQTLAGLVGAALDAAMPASTGETGHDGTAAPGPESDASALALLLHHDTATGGDLRRAIETHAAGVGPADVRGAAMRLLVAADRAGSPRLALLDRVWHAAGDHTYRALFAHRALRLDRRPAAKDLGAALGLQTNRIGPTQAHAERRARRAATPDLDPLVSDLRARLGPACHLRAVDDALTDLGLPPRTDPRSALLVWLAGPYRRVGGREGWIATDPATLIADTRRLLREDGGVRQLDHVTADLDAAGVAAHDVAAWLAAQPAVVVDGLVVAPSRNPADVAERLLSATGRAMSARELAALLPQPHSATGLGTRLCRDRRFVRVDRDHFELTEWGSKAFTEPKPAPRPPTELFPRTGRSQLRVEVDAAVLRGASEPVPLHVVEALGLPCGGRRTFTTRFGPVALTHKATQPIRGSMRPVALAAGAAEGDSLLLEFDAATGDASVELVLASSSAAS